MNNRDLIDILDIAMDREIVAEAFYEAAQHKTSDKGAIELLKELASYEHQHLLWIKKLKNSGADIGSWSPQKVQNLNLTGYLNDIQLNYGAGLQEVLTAAMKREQSSIEFYTVLQSEFDNPEIIELCSKLASQEAVHKNKLELLYENIFLTQN